MAKLTINSLITMTVEEVLSEIRIYLTDRVPEGIKTDGDLGQVEYYLGKLGNDYSYITELHIYSQRYARRFKRDGMKDKYEDMVDLRDALESVASAIKLKYQAVSRMLSVQEQRSEEGGFHPYRLKKEDR